ncbi:MAG: hypothetical protein LBH00_02365 [Planctomycetaceae bacterium]|nr:hypothetical protein [Planctomycetaceae bacterium]
MKSSVLTATLVVALLMGVKGFASPCDPLCDPCGACNSCAKPCDLFSGLKKLVNGTRVNDCGPCNGVVACNPCDETQCDPCGEVGCNDTCVPKIELGKRLRNLFASKACNPCDPCGTECKPCDDTQCDPCGEVGCDDVCAAPKFTFRKLFQGFKVRGCETDCGPKCDPCEPCNTQCDPCDPCGNDCTPCGDCNSPCRGHLIDLPRLNLKKLFDGLRPACNTGCDPCGEVKPCDDCK